jgi:phage virion morphogenesis protein
MSSLDNNIEQVNALFEKLREQIKPSKKLMNPIAGELLASVKENFSNQGANVPGGWPALKRSTIKQKEKRGLDLSILKGRGNLLRSVQADSTESTASAHTNLAYAGIHHFGGKIQIGARTRSLLHRTDAKGNLLKQSSNKNLLVFASKKHKRVSSYTFGQSSYSITIHARPFMVLTDRFRDRIIDIIKANIAV